MRPEEKLVIYQSFPRILTNDCDHCVRGGTLAQNGSGKLNRITPKLLRSLKSLGVNCMWYTGVIEHATKTAFEGIPADNPGVVKGEAGSPYAIKDYYDVAPALAEQTGERVKEFEKLVERTHKAGMKVIIDFVPNHTARVYRSDVKPGLDLGANDDKSVFFAPDNNYYYLTGESFAPHFPVGDYTEVPAKATGNDCFTASPGEYDWYETVKLNYGHDYRTGADCFTPVPDTWRKMYAILDYWASKGVDGFRCDMCFMVPLAFWTWVIAELRKKYPDLLFIGEIYDVNSYRPFLEQGGFDYLYDKVNLYDTLKEVECHGAPTSRITGAWQWVNGLGPRMLNFLENHDEVRFASREYAGDPARVLPSLVVSSMLSTGPMMIYYGQELGEGAHDNEGFAGDNNRTTIFDYWSVDKIRRWYHEGKCDTSLLTKEEKTLRRLYGKVLTLCNTEAAIAQGGFWDLMYVNPWSEHFNADRNYAFLRHYGNETLLIVCNFSDVQEDIRVNIPADAFAAMGIPQGKMQVTELLSGKTSEKTVSPAVPFETAIAAHGAVIYKITSPGK